MPEGDTIHRTAATLRAALVGRSLTRVDLPRRPRPWPTVGATVTGVEARGKHVLVATSDGRWLHTHQQMTGSWHLYAPGQRWRRSPRAARVVLGVRGAVAVCFSSPVVEVLDAGALARHPSLRRLGPDLCDPGADLDEVVARMARVPPDRSIGEVLLDQRVACGVGNVYRCEVLFVHRVHPATDLGAVDGPTRRQLVTTASHLLQANLAAPHERTTVTGAPAGSLWVYGRQGRPCRRCGTTLAATHLGEHARHVVWCPSCQPPETVEPGGTTGGTRRASGVR